MTFHMNSIMPAPGKDGQGLFTTSESHCSELVE
jgi:hypothetical protein